MRGNVNHSAENHPSASYTHRKQWRGPTARATVQSRYALGYPI
jgi:hypothetical protein